VEPLKKPLKNLVPLLQIFLGYEMALDKEMPNWG